jgi:hypothetical protein
MTKEELPNKHRYSHGVNHSSTAFPTAANPLHVRARQLALKKASMDGTTAPSAQRTSASMSRLPAEAAPSACIGQRRGHPPLLPAEAAPSACGDPRWGHPTRLPTTRPLPVCNPGLEPHIASPRRWRPPAPRCVLVVGLPALANGRHIHTLVGGGLPAVFPGAAYPR